MRQPEGTIVREFELLYKRGKDKNSVLSYQVYVEASSGDLRAYDIVKLSGQLDGKKIEHRQTISVGKQKRTNLPMVMYQVY
jgi:hypothetical protein